MTKTEMLLKTVKEYSEKIAELVDEIKQPSNLITSDQPLLIQVFRGIFNYDEDYQVCHSEIKRVANALASRNWDLLPIDKFVEIITKEDVLALRNVGEESVKALAKVIKLASNLDWE